MRTPSGEVQNWTFSVKPAPLSRLEAGLST